MCVISPVFIVSGHGDRGGRSWHEIALALCWTVLTSFGDVFAVDSDVFVDVGWSVFVL